MPGDALELPSFCKLTEKVVLVTGGRNRSQSTIHKHCFKYSIESGRVTPLADMLEPREGHASCLLGNFVYVFGGNASSGAKTYLKTAEKLRVAGFASRESQAWQIIPALHMTDFTPRAGHLVSRLNKG